MTELCAGPGSGGQAAGGAVAAADPGDRAVGGHRGGGRHGAAGRATVLCGAMQVQWRGEERLILSHNNKV